jgi:spore coat protein CotH
MAARRLLAGALLLAALCADVRAAAAQTADDLFNDQILQRIDLYVNTRDWYWLRARYTTNDYYPADMKWNGTTVTNVGIRSRGTGSRSGTKPAIRVDFSHYASGRTFLGLNAIDLNNGWQDPSNVREMLTMKFYRAMGLSSPRMAPAALYINNEYFGLYSVVEEIDEAFLARVLGESSGYLFEYKWTYPYHFEYLGTDLTAYRTLYEPRTHVYESDGALYSPVEVMTRTITDAPDENFAAAVSERLDLLTFVRLAAAQAVIAESDGLTGNWGVNNNYLYRFNGRALHQYLPWDASSSFHALDYPLHAGHDESVLMSRAMKVPEQRAWYYETLLEGASVVAGTEGTSEPGQPNPGWLEREAARILDLVRPAAYADRVKPYSNQEFDDAAAFILAFAQTRAGFVRKEASRFAPGAAPVY